MTDRDHVLRQLMAVIEDRRQNMPAGSYTTQLFQGGTTKIGEKIREEAAEVVDAALQITSKGSTTSHSTTGTAPTPVNAPTHAAEPGDGPAQDHLVHEAADLIYHLLVMLAYHHVTLEQVERKLAGRFGISGLAEKAARPPKSP